MPETQVSRGTIKRLIEQVMDDNPDLGRDDIAWKVVGKPRTRADLEAAVFHLVRDQVREIQRERTRELEVAAYGPEQARQRQQRSHRAPEGEEWEPEQVREALNEETFYVPGKGDIAWGDATIEDHEERIEFIKRTIVEPANEEIARHQAAIQELRGDS